MSFITDCLADERDQRESRTRQEIHDTYYTDGENDAAFGRLPVYAHEAYLEGYVAQLKKRPKDDEGRIQHYSPRQHFAFGWMDGVGDRTDGESNYEHDF
jgi:ribosome modulation factor